MAFPLLNISPSQLEFLFEAERELKSTLNLRNVNEEVRVAFKIKTTNSERFVVCPPAGIVEPGTTRLVKVYLKAQRNYDDELRLCKDRFLVQSIVVDHTVDERDITSSLFRTGQRQEAKLKVIVAPPLAHSSVLENEIRTISMRQGVEGHRAVVRKFSELLLARGIISQAQVVLAFSTVGEIFQGMQNAYKATTAERERSFQQFLGERNNGYTFGERSSGLGSPDRTSAFAEGDTQPLPEKHSGLSFGERHSVFGLSERSVGLVVGSPSAKSLNESDSSSVPSMAFQRRLTTEGHTPSTNPQLLSAQSKWPEVAASHKKGLSYEEQPPLAPPTPAAELPTKDSTISNHSRGSDSSLNQSTKRFNDDALDALFEASHEGRSETLEEDKAEVISEPDVPPNKARARSTVRPLDFGGKPSSDSDTDLAFAQSVSTPERAWRLGRRNSRSRRTIGELMGHSEVEEKTEIEPRLSEEGDEQYQLDQSPASQEAAPASQIALLTEVEPSSADTRETPSTAGAAEGRAQETVFKRPQREASDGTVAPKIEFLAPQLASTSTTSEIEPEPEITPASDNDGADQEIRPDRPLSGRSQWPAKEGIKDTLGRANPVTSIDRLATPAIRKAAVPSVPRSPETGVVNGNASSRAAKEPTKESQAAKSPALATRRSVEEPELREQRLDVQAGTDVDLEPQNNIRTGSGGLTVPIPSGNTRKMAHLFGKAV